MGKNTVPKKRSFITQHSKTILGKCLMPTFCLARLSDWTMMWVITKFNPQQLILILFISLSLQASSINIPFKPERKMYCKIDGPFFVNSLVPEVTHTSGKWGKSVNNGFWHPDLRVKCYVPYKIFFLPLPSQWSSLLPCDTILGTTDINPTNHCVATKIILI